MGVESNSEVKFGLYGLSNLFKLIVFFLLINNEDM